MIKTIQIRVSPECASKKRLLLDKISNDVCTISLKNEIVPTVENWDDLHEHIVKTGQFELLQKRMSATAYRELITAGMDVPGVKSTELTRVNFRSA